MDAFSIFAWIETSALSVWVRESPSLLAFPTVLIFHTIGMAFLAGGNIAVDLRVLGFAARVPLSMMERFFSDHDPRVFRECPVGCPAFNRVSDEGADEPSFLCEAGAYCAGGFGHAMAHTERPAQSVGG
jgi:hypothetical protein